MTQDRWLLASEPLRSDNWAGSSVRSCCWKAERTAERRVNLGPHQVLTSERFIALPDSHARREK